MSVCGILTCINIIDMTSDTPIPQQSDNFWASQEKNRNLQVLVPDDIMCNGDYVNTTIVASYVFSDDKVLPAKANGVAEISELLN